MKPEFPATHLRCTVCHRDGTLALTADASTELEVREGSLRCSSCAAEFPVDRGVGMLMTDPPEHVVREADGLGRFAEFMRESGWTRESILKLPDVGIGYWFVQAQSLIQVMHEVGLQPGEWLLDVGSNTCWAANQFAQRGVNAIALDIATAEMQGLYTADIFIDAGTSYFERVLGTMYEMPIATGTLDYVYCCEVLHHNDSKSLRRTFAEAFRVLKPGGRLLVINETLKTLADPNGVHVEAVEQFEGYEHAFWAAQYRGEAIRAGFQTRMLEPQYHWFFNAVVGPTPPWSDFRHRLLREGRRLPIGRWAYLNYLYHVRGGVQMNMICTKPGSSAVR